MVVKFLWVEKISSLHVPLSAPLRAKKNLKASPDRPDSGFGMQSQPQAQVSLIGSCWHSGGSSWLDLHLPYRAPAIFSGMRTSVLTFAEYEGPSVHQGAPYFGHTIICGTSIFVSILGFPVCETCIVLDTRGRMATREHIALCRSRFQDNPDTPP